MTSCKVWDDHGRAYWLHRINEVDDAELLEKIAWATQGRRRVIRKYGWGHHHVFDWTKVRASLIREGRRRGIY